MPQKRTYQNPKGKSTDTDATGGNKRGMPGETQWEIRLIVRTYVPRHISLPLIHKSNLSYCFNYI